MSDIPTQILRNQISIMCWLLYSPDRRSRLELQAALKKSLQLLEDLDNASKP